MKHRHRSSLMEFTTTCPFDECEREVTVTIHSGTPMRFGKDPDDSYPGDSPEVELLGCSDHDSLPLSRIQEQNLLSQGTEMEELAYSAHVDAEIDRLKDDYLEAESYYLRD